MKQQLLTIMPGTPILYRERAAVVLEHAGGGVFVQLIDSIGRRQFGSTNDWRASDLRKHLNGTFAKDLCEGNMDELLDTVTDLTAMDGTTDYGHSIDKVTLLTVDQCRKYRYIRPLLKEYGWEWTSTPDSTPGGWDKEACFAWHLNSDGNLSLSGCSNTYGARPAFTLPSSLSVKVLGSKDLSGYSSADLLSELLKRQADA
jgi:hypothetical protein